MTNNTQKELGREDFLNKIFGTNTQDLETKLIELNSEQISDITGQVEEKVRTALEAAYYMEAFAKQEVEAYKEELKKRLFLLPTASFIDVDAKGIEFVRLKDVEIAINLTQKGD